MCMYIYIMYRGMREINVETTVWLEVIQGCAWGSIPPVAAGNQ